MSAFSFTDETPADNGSQEFSFGEAETGSSQEFVLNETEETHVLHTNKKRAPAKKLPRAIGRVPIEKKKGKGSKFAKKATKKISASDLPDEPAPQPSRYVQHHEEPKTETLTPVQPQEEESAFNFGDSTEDNGESAFNFGDPGDGDVSEFNFGDATPSNQATEFSFGMADPNEAESAFSFGEPEQEQVVQTFLQPEPPVQNEVQNNTEIPQEIKEFGDDIGGLLISLNNIKGAVEDMYKHEDECRRKIAEAEEQQSKALAAEEFDKADALDQVINGLKAEIASGEGGLSNLIGEAMEKASETPKHFEANAARAQAILPSLIDRHSKLEKELEELNKQQADDNETIEIERENTKDQVESLRKPVEEHAAKIEQMQEEYDTKKAEVSAPFDQEAAEIDAERRSISDKIEDLLNQVEELRKQEKVLVQKSAASNRNRKSAIDELGGELAAIAGERRALEMERRRLDSDIKRIEAPFQSLLDAVEKRSKEIERDGAQIESIKQQIFVAETDSAQAAAASDTVGALVEEFMKYYTERASHSECLENARLEIEQSRIRLATLATEVVPLRASLQAANEIVQGAIAKEAQLEAQKAAAVSTRNFKGAKACADQLKELRELVERSQQTVAGATAGIASNEGETQRLKDVIASAEGVLVTEREAVASEDWTFFDAAITKLDALFASSPFAARLLRPLADLLSVARERTPQPQQLSPEEIQKEIDDLNERIQAAIDSEDYDTADALQTKVDTLTAKLGQN